ncbi:hypothetical protein OY671_009174, partial [Metschnikowia pulcherrima]
ARVVRPGEAVTVLAYGTMVHVAEAVSREKGVDAEIIDSRTSVPLDIDTIEQSVRKTGKCSIVHEATRTSGFGAELSASVQERCFYHLEAPIERVTGFDTPYPHSLEWAYFPEGIAEAEIVAWHVQIGDRIEEDVRVADMMTDKATVEMESPVSGVVIEVAGDVGDVVAIGSPSVVIETKPRSRAGPSGEGRYP